MKIKLARVTLKRLQNATKLKEHTEEVKYIVFN